MSVTPSHPSLVKMLEDLRKRITALEQTQNFGVRDGSGVQRVFAGQQFTKSGLIVPGSIAGAAPSTLFNIAAFDTSGNVRAVLGDLVSGDYGLAVTDVNGATTEILPVYSSTEVRTEEFTSSTSYTDLATVGPSVSAVIGASGACHVIANAFISTPVTASSITGGEVGISIDGNAPAPPLDGLLINQISTGTSATGTLINVSGQAYVTGLSAGAHTFKLVYKSSGGSAGFGNRFLQVRPL
jgi:hypothetical protein